MEDVWIQRHTKNNYLGTMGVPITVPGNPRRFGFLVTRGYAFQFTDYAGRTVVNKGPYANYGGLAGTITTAVPPGVDTISANPNTTSVELRPFFIGVAEYGSLIQSGGTIGAVDGAGEVWEVEGDEVFEQAYTRYDASKK